MNLKTLFLVINILQYIPLKKGVALQFLKLKFLLPIKLFCAKFCWNWPVVLEKKTNVNRHTAAKKLLCFKLSPPNNKTKSSNTKY